MQRKLEQQRKYCSPEFKAVPRYIKRFDISYKGNAYELSDPGQYRPNFKSVEKREGTIIYNDEK